MNEAKSQCPDHVVAALLGSRGAVKDEIQQETGTKLVFSNRGDYFPKSTLEENRQTLPRIPEGIWEDDASSYTNTPKL